MGWIGTLESRSFVAVVVSCAVRSAPNKESRQFFLSDSSIWSFLCFSSLSDCIIWRS